MNRKSRKRQKVERSIVRQLVEDILAAGYSLNVHDGQQAGLDKPTTDRTVILDAMFVTSDEHLVLYRDGHCQGWVYLVYGNDGGHNVIANFTDGLDELVLNAFGVAENHRD